jgi:hypothetical protein
VPAAGGYATSPHGHPAFHTRLWQKHIDVEAFQGPQDAEWPGPVLENRNPMSSGSAHTAEDTRRGWQALQQALTVLERDALGKSERTPLMPEKRLERLERALLSPTQLATPTASHTGSTAGHLALAEAWTRTQRLQRAWHHSAGLSTRNQQLLHYLEMRLYGQDFRHLPTFRRLAQLEDTVFGAGMRSETSQQPAPLVPMSYATQARAEMDADEDQTPSAVGLSTASAGMGTSPAPDNLTIRLQRLMYALPLAPRGVRLRRTP